MQHYVIPLDLYESITETAPLAALRMGSTFYANKSVADKLIAEEDLGAQVEADLAACSVIEVEPVSHTPVTVGEFEAIELTENADELALGMALGWKILNNTGLPIHIRGIEAPSIATSRWLLNASDQDLVLKIEFGGDTPENSQILSSSNHTLSPYNSALMAYDFDLGRWLVLTRP